MKNTTAKTTKRTTAAAEKAAREARAAAKATKTETTQATTKRTKKDAAPVAAAPLVEAPTVELGENEYAIEPDLATLPEGARVKKVVSRNAQKLAQPIWKVELPVAPAASLNPKSNKSKRAVRTVATENGTGKKTYCGGVESPRVQEILNQINRATAKQPLIVSKEWGKSQYPKRVARMLAVEGLVATERREDVGVVYFAK